MAKPTIEIASFSEEHLKIPGQKMMTNHFPMICHNDHHTCPPDDAHKPRGAIPEPRRASPEMVCPIL